MAYKKAIRKAKRKLQGSMQRGIKRLMIALLLLLLGGGGAVSYFRTGMLIPRQELLTGEASFHFIDVGQGDATLILTGDAAILVDAGPNSAADTLVAYLETYVGRLDCLILTHPHEDHVGGADEVIRAFPVEQILMPSVTGNKYANDILNLAKEYDIPVDYAFVGGQYTIEDIVCTLLGPVRPEYENLNNVSAVVRVDVGEISLLLSGDAEREAEEDILYANSAALLDCDIYQVGHHGSSTSTSLSFFTAISPDIAVISCGADNTYGHPHTTVTQILEFGCDAVYRTDKDGTIVLRTDGNTIQYEQN